jgi:hypothetical protein
MRTARSPLTWLVLAFLAVAAPSALSDPLEPSDDGAAHSAGQGQQDEADPSSEARDGQADPKQALAPVRAFERQWHTPPSCYVCADDGEQRKEEREQQDLAAQRAMADAAYWMVIITFAQAVFGLFGLGALLLTLRHTRKSAEAASAAVATASATAEKQLRAYVFCTKVEIVQFSLEHPVRAKITIRNLGQTPAQSLSISSGVTYARHPEKAGDQYIYMGPPAMRMSIGPGAEFYMTAKRREHPRTRVEPALSADEVIAISGGEMAIFVYIILKYIDIFGVACSVEQRYMFNNACVERGEKTAEVCRYGNKYQYGAGEAAQPAVAHPPWWRRAYLRARALSKRPDHRSGPAP